MRCVNITIMVNPTLRTFPRANIQRHFIFDVTARAASFGAWEPSVNLDKSSTIPLAFVSKLADNFSPASVANALSQLMVFHQIFDCQVERVLGGIIPPKISHLNYYRLVFTHQLSRQLLQKILAAIGYLPMCNSNFLTRFMSIVRSFLFTRQGFLYLSQLLVQPLKMFRISNFVPIASSNQTSYAHIQPDRLITQG